MLQSWQIYLKQGRRPLLVACDIYRPAAIEQLQVVGEQAERARVRPGQEKPERSPRRR